jgi:hypothetical protein
VYKPIHDETSLVSWKIKLSLCGVASKDMEQMWCPELNRFKCTINQNSKVQILGFSVIAKMQEWMRGDGGNYVSH